MKNVKFTKLKEAMKGEKCYMLFKVSLENKSGYCNNLRQIVVEKEDAIKKGDLILAKNLRNLELEFQNKNLNNQNNLANKSQNKINKNNAKLKIIEILYKYIIKISKNCVKNKCDIFGYSKFDKKALKLSVYLPLFIALVISVVYFTFFLIGPIISDYFLKILNIVKKEEY